MIDILLANGVLDPLFKMPAKKFEVITLSPIVAASKIVPPPQEEEG